MLGGKFTKFIELTFTNGLLKAFFVQDTCRKGLVETKFLVEENGETLKLYGIISLRAHSRTRGQGHNLYEMGHQRGDKGQKIIKLDINGEYIWKFFWKGDSFGYDYCTCKNGLE